jgi:hypothetical protein
VCEYINNKIPNGNTKEKILLLECMFNYILIINVISFLSEMLFIDGCFHLK